MSGKRPQKNNPGSTSGDTPGAAGADAGAEQWIAIGEVVGAFGVRGELKIAPLTDFPERFERTPVVYLGDEHAAYDVRSARVHKTQVLLTLTGIESVDEAERLRGARLWIPSSELHALDDDQYYLHDVVGMRVRHVNGSDLGTVSDILPAAGGDLFVVRDARTGAEVLLPAVKAFIKDVDLAGGVIVVDPIPGLFDDHFEEVR